MVGKTKNFLYILKALIITIIIYTILIVVGFLDIKDLKAIVIATIVGFLVAHIYSILSRKK